MQHLKIVKMASQSYSRVFLGIINGLVRIQPLLQTLLQLLQISLTNGLQGRILHIGVELGKVARRMPRRVIERMEKLVSQKEKTVLVRSFQGPLVPDKVWHLKFNAIRAH